MSFNITSINLPEVPKDLDLLLPGTTIILDAFKKDVAVCYNLLAKCIPDSNDQRQQKYTKLSELRGRIETFCESYSAHASLVNLFLERTSSEMKKLQRDYQTQSHWLHFTAHGRHLVEAKPDLAKPELKFSTVNVKPSLDYVSSTIFRGYEKVRYIQMFKEGIDKELANVENDIEAEELKDIPDQAILAPLKLKRKNLKTSLKLVLDFADKQISAKEKFLALKQAAWIDHDPAQTEELKVLLDPTGKSQVIYYLKNMSEMSKLAAALCTLLKERSTKEQKLPLEILLDWPDHKSITLNTSQRKFIQELLELQKFTEDPFMQLTLEYLSNVFDAKGVIRCGLIGGSKILKNWEKCHYLAQVVVSMNHFNLGGDAVLKRLDLPELEILKSLGQNLDLSSQLQQKKLTSKQIAPIAQTLKAEAAGAFFKFDCLAFLALKKFSKFDDLFDPVVCFYNAFFEYIKDQVKTSQKPSIVCHNVTLLAKNMSELGEFTLSRMLYVVLKLNQGEHTRKEEFKFLDTIFSQSNNAGNLRKYFKSKGQTQLCIPVLDYITGKDCTMLGESIATSRDNFWQALCKKLGSNKIQFCKAISQGKKIDQELEAWVGEHLFDDPKLLDSTLAGLELKIEVYQKIKADLDELRQNEMQSKISLDKFKQEVHVAQIALKMFYKGYKQSSSISELEKQIMSFAKKED